MATLNVKRILADIADMQKKEYVDTNVFYSSADDSDMTRGYGLVMGPKDTPYEDCPMLFELEFTPTYPFESPKVKFCTYDGYTRFHPNLYVNGKVCLSILGTWEGPKWASTMRISTILVTIQSLLDNDPLKHEPGLSPSKYDFKGYAEFVEHACIQYTIKTIETLMRDKESLPIQLTPFIEILEAKVPEMVKRLRTRLEARVASGEKSWSGLVWGLAAKSTYATHLANVVKIESKLS